MNKFFGHLHTINKHRRYVIRNASHVGLFWHCLKHDLSKYSIKEFWGSYKYYSGTATPIIDERKAGHGFSAVAQHHAKRNAHHWQYWTDFCNGNIICKTMPYKYALESVCDMISASKVYLGKNFTLKAPLDYFLSKSSHYYMTKASVEFVTWCLTQYAESEWKNLNKKTTKAKFEELMKIYPEVEIFEETLHDDKK